MRARRKYLGDAGGTQARFATADHGAQAGAAGTDDYDVIGVVFNRIGFSASGRCSRAVCAVECGNIDADPRAPFSE